MSQDIPSNRNILFVAYDFPPRSGIGVQRSLKFAKYLPEFGYEPLVLTCAEEDIAFPFDRALLEQIPKAKIFRCRGRERLVVEWLKKLRLKFLATFCLCPDLAVLTWLPSARRKALSIAGKYPVDFIYTSVSPYSSVLLGHQLKKLLGVPLVVDYRDPWTDNAWKLWPTRLHYWFESRQERKALEAADAVVVVTPTMKELLLRRYPRLANRIHLIYNGFDLHDFPNLQGTPQSDYLQIGYTGKMVGHATKPYSHGAARIVKLWISLFSYQHGNVDLTTRSPLYLLRAVRALLNEHPEWEDRIKLSFAGDFGTGNRELIRQLDLENNVSVMKFLPHRQAIQLLLDSDVLFLPMESSTNGQRSFNLSGKVFEYFATGKPILAAVPDGDLRDLIDRSRTGWCVDPHDVGTIKSLLEELVEKKMAGTLHVNSDQQVLRQFDRRELTRQLAAVLDSL